MEKTGTFCALFLYSNLSASLPLINGLKDKGVDGRVVSSSAELIQSIVKINVDVIGISVNHPSSVSILQVIKSNTHIPVILFGEDDKPDTLKKIQNQPADFKINGTISTYNIWMKLSGMIKKKMELAAPPVEPNKKIIGGGRPTDNPGGAIHVKGAKAKEKTKKPTGLVIDTSKIAKDPKTKKMGAILHTGPKKQKAKLKPPKVIKNAGKPQEKTQIQFFRKTEAELAKIRSAPKVIKKDMAQEALIKPKEIKVMPQEEGLSQGQVKQMETAEQVIGSVQTAGEDTQVVGSVKSVDGFQSQSNTLPSKEATAMAVTAGDSIDSAPEVNSKIIDFNKIREQRQRDNADAFDEEMQPKLIQLDPIERERIRKMFKDAAYSSLTNFFQNVGDSRVADFKNVTKITVVPVENKDESGYIIFCKRDGAHLPEEVIRSFNQNLVANISKPESKYKIEEMFTFELDAFDLTTWAEANGQFYFTTELAAESSPVMMCYFDRNPVYPFTRYVEETGMYKMDLMELPANVPVTFDAYIYFIRNKRTALYLRRGGSFSSKQIQRLFRRGFKSLLIKEEDLRIYTEFYVKRSLLRDLQSVIVKKEAA